MFQTGGNKLNAPGNDNWQLITDIQEGNKNENLIRVASRENGKGGN